MVRAWNLPPCLLDRQRLLGQHLESHIMFNAEYRRQRGIKAGWQSHPQTRRFRDHIGKLIHIHRLVVEEMLRRGYRHNSPLPFERTVREEPFTYSWDEFLADLVDLQIRQKL
jgi:hypothetical protein